MSEDVASVISVGTVIDVISDDSESLGAIIISVKKSDNTYSNKIATPLSQHSFTLPLPNERVCIIKDTTSGLWYYISTVGSLGFVNHMHNGFKKTVKADTTTLHLGKTFNENEVLRSLPVYEGDTVLQGRNGQSIRLGSTANGSTAEWSTGDINDNPIITIRNGLSSAEDLTNDFSSIYLTAGQQLPIILESRLPSAFVNVNEFTDSQVLLTSDRVVINTKKDNIILASADNIGLSTSEWSIDVNEFATQLATLCDQVIALGEQVQKQGIASSVSTHISAAPGVPTTPPSNIADFQLVSNNSINIANKCQQIKNKLDIMKQ